MERKTWIAIMTGLIALTLTLPSTAAFIGGGGVNAHVEGVASNLYGVDLSGLQVVKTESMGGPPGGRGNQLSNCQLAVPVDTIVINIVIGNTLDLFRGPPRPIESLSRENGDWKYPLPPPPPGASAMCEQDVGTIIISRHIEPGWGDDAPIAVPLAGAMGESYAAATVQENGIGGGTGGGVGIIASNLAEIYIGGGGGGNTVSNCQILVAWNTAVINAGIGLGFEDSNWPDEMAAKQLTAAPNGASVPPKDGPGGQGPATSSCKQTVKLIELVDGDIKIPPSS